MQYINLYQEQFKPQRHISWMAIIASALMVVLVVMALVAWNQQRHVRQVQQQLSRLQSANQGLVSSLAELEQQVSKRKPSALLQHQVQSLRQQLHQRQPLKMVLEQALEQADTIPASLAALAAQPLHNLWLTKISLSDGGMAVRLQGLTAQGDNVALFVEQLARQQVFNRQSFAGLQLHQQENGLYEFVLSTTMEAGQ